MDGRDMKPAMATSPSTGNANSGNSANNNFAYTATAFTNADICQMCLILGIQVMCPNEATKRKHTDDHRRMAASFLSLEDWALPPTETQMGKCFPHYAPPEFFQHQPSSSSAAVSQNPSSSQYNPPQPQPQPRQQQQQQQLQHPPQRQQTQRTDNEQIQRTVAAILFSSSSNNNNNPSTSNSPPKSSRLLSTAESREASISEAVAAVAANLSSPGPSTMSSSKKARSRPSGGGGGGQGAKKRPKTLKNGQDTDEPDVKEQFTKSVIAAIESSVASGEYETNFQLVRDKPSCKWPRFIIDGYAYRVGRVYSTGKCELRCILKQGCNGKAVVEKNGSGYVARIVPGSVHFHTPPTFSSKSQSSSSSSGGVEKSALV